MKERARGGTTERWGEEGGILDASKGVSQASGALRRFVFYSCTSAIDPMHVTFVLR